MGENPVELAVGKTRPLLDPRVALSREYETQDGEKRYGREGRGDLSRACEKDGGRDGGCGAFWVTSSPAAGGGAAAAARQPGEMWKERKK